LNDRLQGVTSTVGADEVLEDVGDTVDQASEPVRSLTGLGRKRRQDAPRDDEDDLYEGDDETYEDDEPLDVEEDIDEDEDDELDEDDVEAEPEDDEPQAARPRRRAAAQGTDRAPRRRAATATKRAPVRRGR
jgi:hypothetical protein